MGGALLCQGMTEILHDLILLPVPPQRSLVRREYIIARQLTQSAPSRTVIWLNPPALVLHTV